VTSARLPTDANIATPRPACAASARIASPSAPDCDTIATARRRRRRREARVAGELGLGVDDAHAVRADDAHAVAVGDRAQLVLALDADAADLAEAGVITTRPFTPFLPHSSAAFSAASGGTTSTARSTGPGIARTDGVGGHRQHDLGLRIDRIDRPLEPTLRSGWRPPGGRSSRAPKRRRRRRNGDGTGRRGLECERSPWAASTVGAAIAPRTQRRWP
jgi:hypothetical protein